MDETSQLDRIYTKALSRKVVFEIFEKMLFWRFFEVLDLVVFRDSFVQAISQLLFTVRG